MTNSQQLSRVVIVTSSQLNFLFAPPSFTHTSTLVSADFIRLLLVATSADPHICLLPVPKVPVT